jgi:hypothetical protein
MHDTWHAQAYAVRQTREGGLVVYHLSKHQRKTHAHLHIQHTLPAAADPGLSAELQLHSMLH